MAPRWPGTVAARTAPLVPALLEVRQAPSGDARVIIDLGTEREQGSACFLLELIFCPAFISYYTFLWGQQLCLPKAGLFPLEIVLDSLLLRVPVDGKPGSAGKWLPG